MSILQSLTADLSSVPVHERTFGRVVAVRGPVVLARIPHSAVGDLCFIESRQCSIPAMVIAFQEELVSLAPYGELEGIGPGATVHNTRRGPQAHVGDHVLGSVLNALGEPIDGVQSREKSHQGEPIDILSTPPAALTRPRISKPLATGIRSIDAFLTLGLGQRIALLAGAGVGKSTLLGMISRNAAVDVSVIALVGERGREVNEFIQDSLGPHGMRRSVVVVSTSDEPALRRYTAALTATAIAEYFRDQGHNVLLMVDSLTRVARAIRDMTLAAGELPVRQGYTPSVYSHLPRLLERAGTNSHGSITGLYTVLTNGERDIDPLAEEVKSLLDGHIQLDQSLAQSGIRPAIDPLQSVSRLSTRLQSKEHNQASTALLTLMARLKRDKDILLLGGTPDAELTRALKIESALHDYRCQSPHERSAMETTVAQLLELENRGSGA